MSDWTFDMPTVPLNGSYVEAMLEAIRAVGREGGVTPAPAPSPPSASGPADRGTVIPWQRYPDPTMQMFSMPDETVRATDSILSAVPPSTWQGREDRVAWVRANYTKGEQALLFRLAYEADGLRVGDCLRIEKEEKGGLK